MAIGITVLQQSTSANYNVTLGATCSKLVVAFTDGNSNNTGIGVTFNGVSMTKGVQLVGGGNSTNIWYMDNPPTGASYTVDISGPNSRQLYGGAYELTGTGVGIGNTASTTGSGTSTTTSITTTKDNSLILNTIGITVSNATTNTNSETDRFTGTISGTVRVSGASLVKATAGAQTTGFNHGSGTSYLVALEVKEPNALTLALAQGSYALTGFTLVMTRTRTLALAFGSFLLTGNDVVLTKMRNFTNKVKNVVSWTNRDKTQ
jgi:hypothetical protein